MPTERNNRQLSKMSEKKPWEQHDPSIFCQCSECWKADVADEKSRRDKAAKPLQDLIAKVKRETRRETLMEAAKDLWETFGSSRHCTADDARKRLLEKAAELERKAKEA